MGDGIILTVVEAEGFEYIIKTIDKAGTVNNYNSLPSTTLFINELAANILFKRDSSINVKEGDQYYDKVPRDSITIQTSGKSLMLFYPEEYVTTMPTQKAIELQSQIDNLNQQIKDVGVDGVGSVVASLLTESKFKELYNRNGQEWVLAQGQAVSTKSKYFEHTNTNKLPDLRGKNHTRVRASGNEDGDIVLGGEQDDSFQQHKHRTAKNLIFSTGQVDGGSHTTIAGGAKNDIWRNLDAEMNSYSRDGDRDPRPSNETRPRNLTVNFFVRIN